MINSWINSSQLQKSNIKSVANQFLSLSSIGFDIRNASELWESHLTASPYSKSKISKIGLEYCFVGLNVLSIAFSSWIQESETPLLLFLVAFQIKTNLLMYGKLETAFILHVQSVHTNCLYFWRLYIQTKD